MLQTIINWLVYSLLKFNPESRLGSGINFFLYDSIKILLLLFFMISFIGFLRSFLPENKVKDWLSRKGIMSNFMASLFGSVTPFCSCSSIPIFLGFVKTGIPIGITFSFLITSPLINEYLVVLMLGFFGWKITVLYVLSGIFIGVASGLILGKMKVDKYLVKDLVSSADSQSCQCLTYRGMKDRVSFGITEARSSPWKLRQARRSSLRICEIRPLETRNRLAAAVVVSPFERKVAIFRKRGGKNCNHVAKSTRMIAVSAGPACLSSTKISAQAPSSES